MTNTLKDRYEVYTRNKSTGTLRLAHSGNSRTDAVAIANRLDERQDTWLFDVDSYGNRMNPEYRSIKAEMAFEEVKERMDRRLDREVQVTPEVVAAALLVMDRWSDQLVIDKRALAEVR